MDATGNEHSHEDPTVEDEFQHAAMEKRQPLCIYCQKPLQIAQRVEEQIVWYWNPITGGYEKMHTLVDKLDQPYCLSCQTPDPAFVNKSLVRY